jgi:serine/threonine protein kinase
MGNCVSNATPINYPCPVQSIHALRDPELYGIEPGSPEEERVFTELITEVNMIAGLHHDRIVAFRGVCLESERGRPQYIVLELASGSLQWYLKNMSRQLTCEEFQKFCVDILSGLVYLHTLLPPIMHRDLKPANILVFIVDGCVSLKIVDVGLARFAAGNNLSARTMTQGAGTVYYMAPEVMSGEGHYGCKVDVFSFGIMMAEIAVCKLQASSARVGDFGVRMKMVADACTLFRRCSSELGSLIEACCQNDPSRRIDAPTALALAKSAIITAVCVRVSCVPLVESCGECAGYDRRLTSQHQADQ